MVELSNEKKMLVSEFSNMVTKIEYWFLQNKLFQPIAIELSSCKIILETSETSSFKVNDPKNKEYMPLAFFRPDTDAIHIFIEHPAFLIRKTKDEKYALLMLLLYHEAGHRLFMSQQREAGRDRELWNVATDLEIHNMYYFYSDFVKNSLNISYDIRKYFKNIDSFLIEKTDSNLNVGLFEQKYLNLVAEEIYADLLNTKKTKTQKFYFSKNGNQINNKNSGEQGQESISVTTSEYTLPSGKKIKTTSIDTSNLKKKSLTKEQLQNRENDTNLRRTLMQNYLQEELENQEKNKGNISNLCKQFLKKMFHIKIDWQKILRNSILTALEKSDYFSWSKPRISLYGMPNAPYLPEQCYDTEKCGTLIVARDESGSMSDLEVAKAAGIIADAKSHYKKIIVIKHDFVISDVKEFETLDETAKAMLLTRCSNGGTSHKDVFEWIKEYYIKNRDTEDSVSCVICITDMVSDIEEYQDEIPSKIPMIYLAPINCCEQNKKSNIKGTIIPVEL